MNSDTMLTPFLKWVGGKRWLTATYADLFPTDFNTYFEPFLGSAAVFFHLKPNSAVLSDRNADLINVYEQIRDNPTLVERELRRHQQLHSKEYFYAERDRVYRTAYKSAARLLYLNRTCWNGLYRVNLRGEFNVPIGTKNSVLLDSDDFHRASQILTHAKILVADFEVVLEQAVAGDFVFLDPPYVTRHNLNGFAKYNQTIFTWDDQERLASAIHRAATRGVMILLTNADHHSVKALYQSLRVPHRLHELQRKSVLAASAIHRGRVTEMGLAINYAS